MKVEAGQSLFDIAIQHNGSVEAVFDLGVKNNLSITDALSAGSNLNEVPVIDQPIVDRYKLKNIVPGTSVD